jgi:hypothetical protein
MKRLLISLAALALAGGAHASGSPVNETNSAAILTQVQGTLTQVQAILAALNSGELAVNLNGTGLISPSPSGQSSNGIPTVVPTVASSCGVIKGVSGSLFFWSVSNMAAGHFLWIVDSPIATPSGAVPQGSTPSTTVTELWAPIPVPASGHLDWEQQGGFPRTFNGGAVLCESSSGTSIVPAGTPNVTGGVL